MSRCWVLRALYSDSDSGSEKMMTTSHQMNPDSMDPSATSQAITSRDNFTADEGPASQLQSNTERDGVHALSPKRDAPDIPTEFTPAPQSGGGGDGDDGGNGGDRDEGGDVGSGGDVGNGGDVGSRGDRGGIGGGSGRGGGMNKGSFSDNIPPH